MCMMYKYKGKGAVAIDSEASASKENILVRFVPRKTSVLRAILKITQYQNT